MASSRTRDRSPLRSSSENALRPVGLMRSPITQNGWSCPMVTVLDRDSRTVCIALLSFDSWRDPETRAELCDARVLSEGDEVETGHARERQRMRGLFEREVEAGLVLVGGGLHALDHGGRHLDAGHLVVHEPKRLGRAQDRDRGDEPHALVKTTCHGLGHEPLEPLRLEADLKLQEAGAGVGLLHGAFHAVLERRRARVLDGADEQAWSWLQCPS